MQLASNCKYLYILQILKIYASRCSLIQLKFYNFVEHSLSLIYIEKTKQAFLANFVSIVLI